MCQIYKVLSGTTEFCCLVQRSASFRFAYLNTGRICAQKNEDQPPASQPWPEEKSAYKSHAVEIGGEVLKNKRVVYGVDLIYPIPDALVRLPDAL
ncbi:hypothetical protein JCM31598_25390 [Desulfonatronum parangueonense]